jgi:hypothetical protein
VSFDLDPIRAALRAGEPDAAARLRTLVEKRRAETGGHGETAAACEEAGEGGLALSEYQLALRDDPGDVASLARLALLYEERGEGHHAIEMAERWADLSPADPEAARTLVELLIAEESLDRARDVIEQGEGNGLTGPVLSALRARLAAAVRQVADEDDDAVFPGAPCDSDVVRFAHLFAGRENVYARQWWGDSGEGGYTPVREPFTFQVARNHLLGSITAGIYPVRLDNTVTFLAFDVDISKRGMARARGDVKEARRLKDAVASEARRLCGELAALGLAPLLEDSGYKGRHLWVFLEAPEPAAVVRQFGSLFLASFPVQGRDLHAEFFPKQASVAAGVGNLIKLPLGIHRRTGRRSRILQADGSAAPDPYAALRQQPRASRDVLHAAIQRLKERFASLPVAPAGAGTGTAPPDDDAAAPLPLPAPPVPDAAWTAADFDTHPEVSVLIRRCAVLAALKDKVEKHRRLTHEERVVVAHSLGHSGAGVLAVNHLFDFCVDTPPDARLKTPLSGNPVSCPKIRKRIPQVTGSVRCHCDFGFARDHYPTPRLHLQNQTEREQVPVPASKQAPTWDPVERARALGVLWAKRSQIQGEIERLEKELQRHLEGAPAPTIDTGDGRLDLVREEGAPPALVWRPIADSRVEAEGRAETVGS